MMPEDMDPAMPIASTTCRGVRRSATATASAAAGVPSAEVGWKPALCTAFGMTVDRRQAASAPTAMPRIASAP